MDFVTGLPESQNCTRVLVITDRLSKGVILEACDKIDSDAPTNIFLRSFVRRHGFPSAITSDRGSQFVGAWWKRFCELLRITRRLSTSHHPQTDGSTERMNQTV